MTGHKQMEWDWEGFLGRERVDTDSALTSAAVQGRRVLITGAGGSIGGRLALAISKGQPETLVLLDSSEHSLYEVLRQIAPLSASTRVRVIPILGSVCDQRLLEFLLGRYRPNLIVHAAAYKHVPLMEENPFSAMANNAVGTLALVTAALCHKVESLVLLSTDKAVNPSNIMGASKRAAELVVLSNADAITRMNAVRLGNVLGSSGSVVPLFEEQLDHGLPLTVTDAEASRYFITLEEAESAILSAATSVYFGKILLAGSATPFRIVDLARYLAQQHRRQPGVNPDRQPEVEFIGLRPGERCHERQFSSAERIEGAEAGLRVVASPHPSAANVEAAMQRIEAAVHAFDLPEMLAATTNLVTDFEPAAAFHAHALHRDAR